MFSIIDSNIFEAIGVIEIGVTYLLIVVGRFLFGTGITFAEFHVYGIVPSRNEQLQISVKWPARILACFFSIQAGTLSGPVPLFGLTFRRVCRVVVKSMTYSSGSWSYTSNASLLLSSRGICSLIDTKKSFILLASSSTFPSVVLFARLCTFDLSVVFDPLIFSYFPPIFQIHALLQCVCGRTHPWLIPSPGAAGIADYLIHPCCHTYCVVLFQPHLCHC